MSILDRLRTDLTGTDPNEPIKQRQEIQDRIQTELDFWNGKKEWDTIVYPNLKAYWDYVQFGDNWTPTGTPWSSAWVSYTLRNKGFPKRSAHWKYIEDIIENSEQYDWNAFDLSKSTNPVLNVGDVLIYSRDDEYATHGDIVYKIENGQAFLIGGNVDQDVSQNGLIQVDENQRAISTIPKYKIILKQKSSDSILKKNMYLLLIPLGILIYKRFKS